MRGATATKSRVLHDVVDGILRGANCAPFRMTSRGGRTIAMLAV